MFKYLCQLFSKTPKDISTSNYSKWFGNHHKIMETCISPLPNNIKFIDECNREVDEEKYVQLKVSGNKLSLCNIHDGDIIFCQHKDNIKSRKENPICLFENGNIGQVAFEGNIDNYTIEEIYNQCLSLKSDTTENEYSLEKLTHYIKNLQDCYNHNIIIAFKYNYKGDKYYKEWYMYFDNEYLGDVIYSFTYKY